MRINSTKIAGVREIHTELQQDERGQIALGYGQELAQQGLEFIPVRSLITANPRKYTLRGLHYQEPPDAEGKLVHLVCGRIYDVAVDLRPESETYRQWQGWELSTGEPMALYLPPGIAHGFLTLEQDSTLLYFIDRNHVPGKAQGRRWNDPAFGISWPAKPAVIKEHDRNWPLLES